MPTINDTIQDDANFLKLRAIDERKVHKNALELLIDDEEVAAAFATIRDQVIFTNKRIMVVNVQGVTGMKVSYTSYPYAKILYYRIVTNGLMDIDSEMMVVFDDNITLRFDFLAGVNIKKINEQISNYVL